MIACGRNETPLRDLQNENPTIEAIGCDITVPQDVLTLAAASQDRHGRLDVLINNAGIMEHVDLLDEEVSDARIVNEIAVNLTGPILLTRRLLPLLRAGRDPLIVMVSSGFRCFRPARAGLIGEQGGASLLRHCAASAIGWRGHQSRRGSAAIGRYAGDEYCPGAKDVGKSIGGPGVARYRKRPR